MIGPRFIFIKGSTVTPVWLPKNGIIYNGYAAFDSRNIAAEGWRLPIYGEPLRGNIFDSGPYREPGIIYWDAPNDGATNESGFTGRGSGMRNRSDGVFYNLKSYGRYWCTTDNPEMGTYAEFLVSLSQVQIYYNNFPKHGFSVRLVREATEAELLLPDGTSCDIYIGNNLLEYPTFKYGPLVIMQYNLCETLFRNSDSIPFAGSNGINYTNTEWRNLVTPGRCPYNNDPNNI